jgi:hypothetical protein
VQPDQRPFSQGNEDAGAENKNEEENDGHHHQVLFYPLFRALGVAHKDEKVGTEGFRPLHPPPVAAQLVYHFGTGLGDVSFCVQFDFHHEDKLEEERDGKDVHVAYEDLLNLDVVGLL